MKGASLGVKAEQKEGRKWDPEGKHITEPLNQISLESHHTSGLFSYVTLKIAFIFEANLNWVFHFLQMKAELVGYSLMGP